MRTLILISLLSAIFLITGQPAFADHRGHGYNKHHHYKHHHKRKYRHKHRHHHRHGHHRRRKRDGIDGDDLLLAAGIVGGAVVLGTILSQPAYAAPPPRTYEAPPPRQPHCVVDDIYRYLPDGRIQWGERTRCY